MKIRALFLTLFILFAAAAESFAVQLPRDLREYLQSQNKVPTVRFDGIVLYNDNTMYIPVIPSHPKKTDSIKIVKTYPLNQSMDSLPDMVLFNDNYALLKIIKTGNDTSTVRNLPDIPEEILTGIIPQDILVPRGLVFPENLAGILGDVQIPFVGSAKKPSYISTKKAAPLPSGKRIESVKKTVLPDQLKDKLFFVNNFQTEYLEVFSSGVSEPLYSLKTSGVMKDVKPFDNGKYLLAATNKQKNLDVIDVAGEYVTKHIDLTANPSEIVIDDNSKTAYVASYDDESLFVVNLETFSVKEKIQLAGAPQRLSLSADGTKIAYTDLKTSNVYILNLTGEYENKLITKYPNVTKLLIDGNNVYLIARTNPVLRVVEFDLNQDVKTAKTKRDKRLFKERKANAKENIENEIDDVTGGFDFKTVDESEVNDEDTVTYSTSIKDFDIGEKPADIAKYGGKIFVLCAGNNTVYMLDRMSWTITSSKLPMDGFSKTFSLVPNSNYAVITNMGDLKYAVYDMDKNAVSQIVPISEYINSVTVLERKQ